MSSRTRRAWRPDSWSPAAVALVALVVLSVGPWTLAAGSSQDSPARSLDADGSAVTGTVTFAQVPGERPTVAVTFAIEVAASVEDLVVDVRTNGTVVERTGVSAAAPPNGDGTRIAWGGEVTDPSFTYHADGDRVGDGWTFASVDYVVRYRDDDGVWHATDVDPHSNDSSNRIDLRQRTAGEGYVGSRVQFLGPHETHSRTRGEHTITLVVPADAELTADPAVVLDGLAAASERLAVGDRDRRVNVFVRHDGTFGRTTPEEHGTQDVTMPASVPYGDGAANTWLHEYVHTRQQFVVEDRRMRWVVEASAEYYELLLAHTMGQSSFAEFHEAVSTDAGSTSVLADPSSSSWQVAKYRKGARVLAALDAKIRRTSDGERSLQYVLRRMNEYGAGETGAPEPVSYEAFRDLVAAAAGERLDDWLDRYLTTSAVPSVPRESGPFATAGAAGADPGSTGTETASTVATSPDPSATEGPTPNSTVGARSPGASTDATSPGFGAATALFTVVLLVVAAIRIAGTT